MFLEKRSKSLARARDQAASDESFEKQWPAIFEYLTKLRVKKDVERRTSTMLIFCEDGLWKACVNDRENDETAFWSAPSYEELLTAVESDLAVGQGEWRHRSKPGKK